jgi:WD40 repeat protein
VLAGLWARALLRALPRFVSRRMDQLNFPVSSLELASGMSSSVLPMVEVTSGRRAYTGWLRRLSLSGLVLHTGLYSVERPTAFPDPCVKVSFPLPYGSATVFLRLESQPDGSFKLVSSGSGFGEPGSQTVLLWDKDTLLIRDRQSGGGSRAVFSPDGKWIVSGGENRLWLWDQATGVKWKLRDGEQKKVGWLSYSPDSRRVLVTDPGGPVLYLWDVAARKQLCRIPVPTGLPTRGVIGPDGRSVACGIWRQHLLLWRLSNLGRVDRSQVSLAFWVTSAAP